VIGFHPALLPNNRGRHPIIWALFLGLKKTGSTFFIMDEGADTGDIISQKEIKIYSFDDAGTLYSKIKSTAITQMLDFTDQLQKESKFNKIIKQNKAEGNSWRKRGRIDGKIDFRMNTEALLNLIRALTRPYIGAHIEFNEQEIKIWSGKAADKVYSDNIEPGKILESDKNKIIVKTYDSAIEILDHEFGVLPLKNQYL
jgi:methionyl-tRNA formyltransferase